MADVEFGLLGPIEVRHDGRVLPLGGMRPRAVLALLLLADGTPVTEQRLIDALWGEEPPTSARNSLQSHISRLRSALGPTGARLSREPAGYRLAVRPDELDLHRAQARAEQARDAVQPSTRARLISEALGLWRGPALAEFADLPGLEASGLAADRVRLEELHRTLRDELLEARLAAGEHTRLLPDLEAAAAADPLRERPHRMLAVALYRCGRVTDAVGTLRRYRHRLADETGLDPTAELAALESALLAGDPALRPPSVVAPGAPRTALLAAPANPFFGRAAEREALQAAIRAQRLVTVTGPGGVGKTRLVLELLADAAAPVVLLDLAPLHDGTDVLAALATALGVRPSGARPLAEAVLDALREQRLLVVLDNCEHLTAAVVELVTAVLRHAPAVTVLATSRSRLGLAEEQVVPLGPLPVPAADSQAPFEAVAVQLFTDRARRVRPSFALTAADAERVGQICRRLDGLPLALELAASMVAALDLEAVLMGLDSQLELTGRAGGRHRTLRAVVDSSFTLLDEDDRTLFDVLSGFADWFDLAAAREVAGAAVAGGLVRLVDASLVLAIEVGDGRLRYRMLETLRQYGRERLHRHGRYDEVVHRVVGWATGFVERAEQGLRGPDEADWAHRVEIEFANVRAAWEQALLSGDLVAAGRIAVALSEHAQLRSLHEPWTWAIALARRADLPDETLADEALVTAVFGAAAVASNRLGDPDAAEAFARAGLARPGRNRWRCLHPLSTALMMRGDHEDAARCCAEGAAEPDCPPVVQAYLEANGWLARAYAGTATPQDVEGPVRRLVHGGWPSGRAWGWFVAAEAVRMADPAECIRRLERATEIARAARSPFILALAEVGLLAAAVRTGDHATAVRLFPQLIRGWQRAGSWFQQWTTLRTLAILLAERGADEQAAVLLGAADAAPEAPAIGGAEAPAYDALRVRLASRLGAARFTQAATWAAGRPRTAVIEYALQALQAVTEADSPVTTH